MRTRVLAVILLNAFLASVAQAYTETFDTDVTSLWRVGTRQWDFADGLDETNTLIRPIVTSTPGWTGSTITAAVPTNGYPTSTNTPTYRTQFVVVDRSLDTNGDYLNIFHTNLGNADQISATFRLSSSITDGTNFIRDDFWKWIVHPQNDGFASHFRFWFAGDIHGSNDDRPYITPGSDPSFPGEPYDAWFSKAYQGTYPNFVNSYAHQMQDNIYVTLSTALNDPSLWTSSNGKLANSDPEILAEFNEARRDVQTIGFTLGGGNYAVNGFAFMSATGGVFEIDSFTVTPEPGSALLLVLSGIAALSRRRHAA
ncbi:MAG: PEP-CTERM sorting domain-containing protein [Phycisphaeraceae bacterium]|nr:PEP-CTERM sorting domain-containing protein [Phycisphaeraceae bacterium]